MKVTAIPLAALALVCTTAVAQEFSVYTWVDDDVFALVRQSFDYDARDLDARVESTNDRPENWHHELISVRTAYSDERPPAAAAATRTGIRSQRTDPNAVMARTEQRSEQFAEQTAARQEAGAAEDEAAAARKQTADERKANCEQAQQRAENYSTARRLYRPMADGSREYLTDQELSDARAAADEAVNTWCK